MNISSVIAFHFCVKCTLRILFALRATLSHCHMHTMSTQLEITRHNSSYIIVQREEPAVLVIEDKQEHSI